MSERKVDFIHMTVVARAHSSQMSGTAKES